MSESTKISQQYEYAVDNGARDSCEQAATVNQGSADCIADAPSVEGGCTDAVTDSDNVHGVHTCPSRGEKDKDPNRRRSKSGKRRSGFSRGRVSMTQLSKDTSAAGTDMTGSELYKQIPVELSDAERLSLLSRLQLRYALEVLDAEFADVPGFDNFKAEAVESVGAAVDQMESDGRFEWACTTPRLTANPVNLRMDSTISSLTSCIKRLEKEDADWEEVVSMLETQAQSAEQQLCQLDMEYSDIPDNVKELSKSFLPEPKDLPDLSAICTDTVRDVKTVSLLMEDYCQSVKLLNIVHTAAGRHMDSVIKKLDEANHCQRCDPKESIQRLLAC